MEVARIHTIRHQLALSLRLQAVQVQLGARRPVARGLQGGLHRRGVRHDLLHRRPQGLPARGVLRARPDRLRARQVRAQGDLKCKSVRGR